MWHREAIFGAFRSSGMRRRASDAERRNNACEEQQAHGGNLTAPLALPFEFQVPSEDRSSPVFSLHRTGPCSTDGDDVRIGYYPGCVFACYNLGRYDRLSRLRALARARLRMRRMWA